MGRRAWRLLVLPVLVAACGDAPTTDARGYTKAPLERAGVFPREEIRTDVSRFGQTNRPRAEILTLPDTTRPAGN